MPGRRPARPGSDAAARSAEDMDQLDERMPPILAPDGENFPRGVITTRSSRCSSGFPPMSWVRPQHFSAAEYVAHMFRSKAATPDPSPVSEPRATAPGGAPAWPLIAFAIGYNLAHHNSLVGEYQGPRGTRVADWVDLITPFVVALPLLGFLVGQRPRRGHQLVAAVGAVLYVEGHGVHLAANSVSNAGGADAAGPIAEVVHFWDEIAGHYLWYLGLAIMVGVCAHCVRGRPLGLRTGPLALGGAVCGLTWATNGLEGGTAVFSLIFAVGAIGLVDRERAGLSVGLLAAGTVAAVVLVGYGLTHGGFPQPSSL